MNQFEIKENPLLGEKYYRYTHKSGLEIYIIPKKLSTYYATLTTKYGSVDNQFRIKGEQDYTVVPNGIAHFLEHKMFENEDGVDAFEKYGATGADANAYTSFLETSYLFSCTSNFYESLAILIDTVTHPYFTAETVEKEQGIIGEEIGMMNDNPGWVLLFNMLDAMYREHSVKINIAGSVQSISEITADLLYRCYRTFYNPANMVLIVCGDADPEQVVQTVEDTMPQLECHEVESVYAQESPDVVRDYIEAQIDVARPIFAIGYKDTDISPEPRERMRKSALLSVTLEAMFGPSSPIYNELYEQGLLTGTLSYNYEHNRSFSFIEISAETEQTEQVSARIIEYIEQIKRDGLNDELFTRAKKVVYAQTLKSFDSTEEINSLFLNKIIDGIDAFDIPDALAAVQKDDCDALVRAAFRDSARAISVIRPKEVS